MGFLCKAVGTASFLFGVSLLRMNGLGVDIV